MAELLSFDGVTAGYDESVVLENVSFSLGEGESLALLGRNGVGKTTLLVTLMGFTRMHKGDIRWQGGSVARLAPHRRAQAGLGWVPQERYMFPSLTVGSTCWRWRDRDHGTSSACTKSSRAWKSGAPTSATSSRAANSRCWPLPAP
jgi:ABC-type multidrug transport system ATPase subunit